MTKKEINKIYKAMKLIDQDNEFCCIALDLANSFNANLKDRFCDFFNIKEWDKKAKYGGGWWEYSPMKPWSRTEQHTHEFQNERLTALALFLVAEKDVL